MVPPNQARDRLSYLRQQYTAWASVIAVIIISCMEATNCDQAVGQLGLSYNYLNLSSQFQAHS